MPFAGVTVTDPLFPPLQETLLFVAMEAVMVQGVLIVNGVVPVKNGLPEFCVLPAEPEVSL